MNFSTLLHKAATGGFALDRAQNKAALSEHGKWFAGAAITRDRTRARPVTPLEDARNSADRIKLLAAARQLEEDYPFFDGILHDFETYTVGELNYRPNTGDKEADKALSMFLQAEFMDADASGYRDLQTLARLAVRSEKRDGDCGFIIIETDDAIKLQAVSSERIGGIGTGDNGITIDKATGAPQFYKIYSYVNGKWVHDVDVPASDFLFYVDPIRFEQYRGFSAFSNCIEHALDLYEIVNASKVNVKYRAHQLPYVRNENGKPTLASGYAGAASGALAASGAAPKVVQVDGVEQQFIRIGSDIVEFPNDFPNSEFLNLVTELKREIAAGAGIPYEFTYNPTALGGVIGRFVINKAERVFEENKRRLRRILEKYKNRVIEKGIRTGRLDIGAIAKSPRRFDGVWHMGRSVSVDYGREVDADIKLIEAGLMSPQEVAADNARDLSAIAEDIEAQAINQMSSAKRISESAGVPFEVALSFVNKKFPNPITFPRTDPILPITSVSVETGAAKPTNALIETIGIGGTQALIQVQSQVAAGILNRIAAINTLRILFGITEVDAASLVPEKGSAEPIPEANQITTPPKTP